MLFINSYLHMKKLICVCGSDGSDKKLTDQAKEIAYRLGRLIAKNDGVVICGGHGGIMEAVCKGAKEENGITIGIMPYDKDAANKYVDIAIPTDLGNIRNYLVSNSGDFMVAIGGRWGTLNEISYRMITAKPIIFFKGTGGCVDEIQNINLLKNHKSDYYVVDDVEEAIKIIFGK